MASIRRQLLGCGTPLNRPATLVLSRRLATFQSKEFYAATKEIPLTPGGKNPYELFEMPITKATTLDDLAKQRRELVQKYHPDAQGGSTERMAEINAAHTIIREHHSQVLKRMAEAETSARAQDAYRQHKTSRAQRDEDLGRSGGVNRQNVRSMNAAGRPRTQKEIESAWATFKAETESHVLSMCRRYEYAIQQGQFFRKSAILNEIAVRERWLRKCFVKGVWEEVHELRGDLLKRGTRNAQQSQMAEEMVTFAGATQKKLSDDFSRLTQQCVQSQSRMYVERAAMIIVLAVFTVKAFKMFASLFFHGSLTVRLRPAILGY